MKRLIPFAIAAMLLASCKGGDNFVTTTFDNPVLKQNFPDPTVIDDRERSGYFYAYATQNGQNEAEGTVYLQIFKSTDMIDWEFVGDGFGPGRPQWSEGARIWAPDINYINGKYVLYYAQGVWGDPYKSASGVAVADNPEGPFVDQGMIVDYETTGVGNSIDPNFFDDGTAKYLFWGSLGSTSGLYGVQLTDDGLHVKEGSTPVFLGAKNMEGSYIHKRDGYYYFFASQGSCCEKENSTYHIVVGRASHPFGPYIDPEGNELTDLNYPYTILEAPESKYFAGPGHNAEIITDDAGQDWMLFHTYWAGNGYEGRCMAIGQVKWENGWPYFEGGVPAEKGEGPKWINAQEQSK